MTTITLQLSLANNIGQHHESQMLPVTADNDVTQLVLLSFPARTSQCTTADPPRFQTRTTSVSFCGTFLIHSILPHYFVGSRCGFCCDGLPARCNVRPSAMAALFQEANTNRKHDPHCVTNLAVDR